MDSYTFTRFFNLEWWKAHIKPGFEKGWSYIIAAGAVLIGLLPDLINLALANWTMVDALPTLSPEKKLYLFAGASIAKLLLGPIKQQPDSIKVATVPKVQTNGDDPGA